MGPRKSPNFRTLASFYLIECTFFAKNHVNPIPNQTMDGMKMKTTLAVIALIILLASCARSITPYEAANGKAKCGRSIR